MDNILEEIKAVPGIIGSCIFSMNSGVLARNLPTSFEKDNIEKASRYLVKLYASGRSGFSDLSELSIVFEEAVITLRELSSKNYLIVFSEKTENSKLLSMSMDAVIEELNDRLQISENHPDTKTGHSTSSPSHSPAMTAPGRNSLPIDETMPLIEKSLAKVIGPIAAIIFDDCRQKWSHLHNPTMENIDKLTELIAMEIGNEAKEHRFISLISEQMKRH